MGSESKLLKATLLGGFATGSVLCFCLTLAGMAWFFVALFCSFGDHRTGASSYAPPVVFALSSVVSCLLSCRFGWRVGLDWYHNGR
jgi:hypothetical protein